MLKTNTGIKHPKPKVLRHIINNAILKLDKKDYEILYELYFKNTSIRQLARNIGASRATVRWRRDKALKRLKKIILKQVKIRD